MSGCGFRAFDHEPVQAYWDDPPVLDAADTTWTDVTFAGGQVLHTWYWSPRPSVNRKLRLWQEDRLDHVHPLAIDGHAYRRRTRRRRAS